MEGVISLAQVANPRVTELAIGNVKAEIQVSLAPLRVQFRVELLIELEHFVRSQSVNRAELLSAIQILLCSEEGLAGVIQQLVVDAGFQGIKLADKDFLPKGLNEKR